MTTTTWSDGYIESNGIRLHYTRGGSGPALVLSHGLTDSARSWRRTAEALASDYDVVMYDARGHGLSDAPERGYAAEDRAADLAGLVAALRLDRPMLLGHSMGADGTAATAALYPALPRAIILEDPPWWQHGDPNGAEAAAAWRANLLRQQASTHAELLAEVRAEHPEWTAEDCEAWAQDKPQVRPQVFAWLNGMRERWRGDARRIQCPALLLTAEPGRGAIVTPELAQEFLTLAPCARVVQIAGAGHSLHREQFAPFIAAVRAFLEEQREETAG